jgi:hypothetical protein
LWAMYGAADVAGLIAGREGAIALVAALAALPAYNLWMNYARMDISSDREAFNFARAIVDRVPRDAVIFADGDEAVFALEYYRHTIAYSNSRAVIVSQGLLEYEWYYDELRDIMSEVTFAPAFQKKDARTRAVEIVNVTFAEGRVVCFDNSSPLLPEFEYETRGNLSCVIAQKS